LVPINICSVVSNPCLGTQFVTSTFVTSTTSNVAHVDGGMDRRSNPHVIGCHVGNKVLVLVRVRVAAFLHLVIPGLGV
jgi:hypothetical protein